MGVRGAEIGIEIADTLAGEGEQALGGAGPIDAAGVGVGGIGEEVNAVVEAGDGSGAAGEAGLIDGLAIEIVEAAEAATESSAAIELVVAKPKRGRSYCDRHSRYCAARR